MLSFSLRHKTALKNTPFSIIIFYAMRVTSFLSNAAVTFLSLTFNSCHCTLLLHSLAQESPSQHNDAAERGEAVQGPEVQTHHLHQHGQVAQENMGH